MKFHFAAEVQALLGSSLIALTYLVVGLFHAPLWVAGVLGLVAMGMAWFAYFFWQANHRDWWPPWDEGLPQEMRMMNAFMPVLMWFLFLVFVLVPVFTNVRRKARQHQKQTTSSVPINSRAGNESNVVPT